MAGIQRVLIVDDLPHARRYLRMILEATGVSCVEAESAEDALRSVSLGADLVITDLNMPGAGGYALIERIQMGALGMPPPPIAVCSSTAGDEAVRERLIAMGCVGVIAKPFLPMDVHNLVAGLG